MISFVKNLEQLYKKEVYIFIENGKLAHSCDELNEQQKQWFLENESSLVRTILEITERKAFKYDDYSTGNYPYPGVTLQLSELRSGEELYVIYNASLTRAKTTTHGNKGSPLPKRHFRVGKRSKFYKFWLSTNLPLPRSVSAFNESMGKLKTILFDCDSYRHDGRIENKIIPTLTITKEDIAKVLNKSTTTTQQNLNKSSIKPLNKKYVQDQVTQELEKNPTTCNTNYGISKQGSADTRDIPSPSIPNIYSIDKAQGNSVDEWLDEYNNS